MSRPLPHFLLGLLAWCSPVALAHGPLESTVALFRTGEGCELFAEITLASASRLLPADDSAALNTETFPTYHQALVAAADRVCNLLDAEGRPIPPERNLVSLNQQGEIRVVRLYAPAARPVALRFDLLAALPPDQFCILTDHTSDPVQRKILVQTQPSHELAVP